MAMWREYDNGNYKVQINLGDGTKIRICPDDEVFEPAFPENVDVHITNKCDGGCPYCYAGCTEDGHHADLHKYLKLFNSLHPYTEFAINGNDFSHPEMGWLLQELKDKRVICNLTVNQLHFERFADKIQEMIDNEMIFGLGVSLRNPTPEFISLIKKPVFRNAVIHVINGIVTENQIKALADNKLKLLILGYKMTNRGWNYISTNKTEVSQNQKWLYDNLEELPNHFKLVSFDNLALTQLSVKRLLTDDEWEKFYMGDDGSFTFAINLVEGYFAENSTSPTHYRIGDKTIDEMFEIIKKNKRLKQVMYGK